MTADIVDAAAGLAPDSPVALLRRQREVFVRHTQGSHDVMIAPADPGGVNLIERAAAALRVASIERDSPLIAHYGARLREVGGIVLLALAMMAVDRAAMGAQFREERLEDPKVLPMLDRIFVEPAEEYCKGGDETRHAARVLVETKSGKTFARETWNRPGSPANQMTEAQLQEKFSVLAGVVLSAPQIVALTDAIKRLDALPAAALRPLLTPQQGR